MDPAAARNESAKRFYGRKAASIPQKVLCQAMIWGAVEATVWFLIGGGREAMGAGLGMSSGAAAYGRATTPARTATRL